MSHPTPEFSVIKYLLNLFRYTATGFQLLGRLSVQKKFLKKVLYPDLMPFIKNHDDSLDERDFAKITKYYGLAVPGVLGEAFALLHGKKMSQSERSTLTYLGVVTGLFDDFFDKKPTPEEHILSLIADELNAKINGSNEELFSIFYRKALTCSSQKELLKKSVLDIFEAQLASKRQTSPTIDREEIKKITFQKGGCSLAVYRLGMDRVLYKKETAMLHALGSLFQLENDIFDIYKDHQKGIRTLVTTETNMQNLREEYISLISEFILSVDQLDYHPKNKKRFIRIILVVISRGFVALDMLIKNQKPGDPAFVIDQYERKELICDMEKPVNFFRSSHYFARVNPK